MRRNGYLPVRSVSVTVVLTRSRGHRAGTQGCIETTTTECSDLSGAFRIRRRSALLLTHRNYQEWKDAALVLDEYMNFDEWKRIDEDPFYDWRLVRKVRKSLKTLRERRDARGLVGVLETCLRTNFAGVESAR